MKRVLVIPADAQARLKMLDAKADQKSNDGKQAAPSMEFSRSAPVRQQPLPPRPEHRR